MVEPDAGEPDMPALLAELDALGVPMWAIVEHDMYPAPAGQPLAVATRTCSYYAATAWAESIPGPNRLRECS